MNIKQHLLQLYKLECLIKEHLEQIEHLRRLAQKSTNTLSLEPKAKMQGDRLCSLVAKIVDLQADLNKEIDNFIDFKKIVLEQISKLECTQQKTVIMARYVNFKEWEDIAHLLGCNRRHALRIHNKALIKLEQIKNKERAA